MTVAIEIKPDRWHDEVAKLLAAGARFAALYGTDDRGVRCVMMSETSGGSKAVVLRTQCDAAVQSVIDLAPAEWDEREAHDLYGIQFDGHDPMRPFVNIDESSDDWQVPVTGVGVHEIAVGPIHAGIIESGHFRIHAVGELMLLVDVRLFYKHRGLEAAAQGRSFDEGQRLIQRACAGCAVANSLAYVMAVEELLGVRVAPRIARQRTLLLELERLWNHLNDLSAMCAGVGFAPGTMAFAALKEDAQRLNDRLFGHRFLFNTVSLDCAVTPLSPEQGQDVRATLAKLSSDLDTAWRVVLFNASVQERWRGAGVLPHKAAARAGAVGPAARASGINIDARVGAVGLAYDDFTASVLHDTSGDAAARARQRHAELLVSINLLNRLTADADDEGRSQRRVRPTQRRLTLVGVGRVESARGETICCVEADGDKITRVHLRTASYRNWPLVAAAAADNLVGEFPIINKSFELCYSCVDR